MKYLISVLLSVTFFLPVGVYSETGVSGEIVYSSYTDDNWQIWSLRPDSSSLSRLTLAQRDFHYPAFSSDGKKIAYVDSEGVIWVMDTAGRELKIPGLPNNCTHPSWSPDSTRLVFVCYFFINRKEDSHLWVADVKTNKVRKLMEQTGIQSYPSWSPDGSTIVYTTGYRVSDNKIKEELWIANSDGTKPRTVLSDEFSNIQPDWSPDGKRIVFASDRGGNMDVWVMDKNGKHIRQLTHHKSYDADPNWSPDGSNICFTSTRNGKMDIWIMDSSGGNTMQITGSADSPAESKEPDWARSGR